MRLVIDVAAAWIIDLRRVVFLKVFPIGLECGQSVEDAVRKLHQKELRCFVLGDQLGAPNNDTEQLTVRCRKRIEHAQLGNVE